MPSTIRSGRAIFAPHEYGALHLLGKLPPGLVVDVGAAAGFFIERISKYSPDCRFICFEPFPGNWPFLEKAAAVHGKSQIIRSAVDEKAGTASFFIASIAKPERKWVDYPGYSSAGRLVTPGEVTDPTRTITVPVTTIDEHVDEPILFMKIDVQGSELGVLKGSTKCFSRGIDMLYIEFSGETDVMQFLVDHDYQIYDHEYFIIPRADADTSHWDITFQGKLSTGTGVYKAWPLEMPTDPIAYCAAFTEQRQKVGSVWTDLVAIKPSLLPGLIDTPGAK